MRVVNYSEKIKESLEELSSKLAEISCQKVRDRLEILMWLRSGKIKTMKGACGLKGLSNKTGHNLWCRYKSKGLEGYLEFYKGQKGRHSPLRGKKKLEEKLAGSGFGSINEAREWILETYGIVYTENGLGNYFRSKKVKLKTGRDSHPKKDESARSAYKKI